MHKGRVLIVEDLPDVCATLSGLLLDEGYDVRSASSRAQALQILGAERFHVAVLDVRLDEADEDNRDGILLMHEIRRKHSDVAVIILTGYASVKMVREALQPDDKGQSPAFGFLEKTEADQLPEYVRRAFERAVPSIASSVNDLIAQGENEHVEFKSSIRWDFVKKAATRDRQEAIAITIAGMLNSNGGTLLIGVKDDGTILGIEKDLQTLHKRDTDGFQLALTDIVRSYLGIEHVAYIHTRFELVDDKLVGVISIDKSPSPVFFTSGSEHKFWVRMGNSTRSLDVKATTSYIQANWK